MACMSGNGMSQAVTMTRPAILSASHAIHSLLIAACHGGQVVCRRDLAVKALQHMERTLLTGMGQGATTNRDPEGPLGGTSTHNGREGERSLEAPLDEVDGGGAAGMALHRGRAASPFGAAAAILSAEPCTAECPAAVQRAPSTGDCSSQISSPSSIPNITGETISTPPPSGNINARRVDSFTMHGVRAGSSSRLQRLGFPPSSDTLTPRIATGGGEGQLPVASACKARECSRNSIDANGSPLVTPASFGKFVSLFRNMTVRGNGSVAGDDIKPTDAISHGLPTASTANQQHLGGVRQHVHTTTSPVTFKFAADGWNTVVATDAGSYRCV